MTFATYNLVQKFRFLVKATFQCVDKTLWTELRGPEVWVCPPFTKEKFESEGGEMGKVLQGLNVKEGSKITGVGELVALEGVLGLAAGAVLSF